MHIIRPRTTYLNETNNSSVTLTRPTPSTNAFFGGNSWEPPNLAYAWPIFTLLKGTRQVLVSRMAWIAPSNVDCTNTRCLVVINTHSTLSAREHHT